MRRTPLLHLSFAVVALGAAAAAHAQSFYNGASTHSISNTNAGIWSGSDVGFSSSTDFYINGINIVGGSSWDSNISVGYNGSYYDTVLNSWDTYTLGTQISGSQDWFFGGVFGGMFALGLSAPVANGTYDATFEVLGGTSDSDMNVLHSFTETIEVVDFGLNLSTPDTDVNLAPGDSTVIRHQLENPSSDAFLINSRYMAWGMAGVDQFNFNFSDGYPAVLNPGDNMLVNHLDVTALPSFTTAFTFDSGVIGGRYADDAVFQSAGQTTLHPVPEPASLAVLGLGGLALLRRRRK